MSPTATPSEVPTGRRRALAPRWLVVAHRYLGIAVGGLMLLWCLSGFVMLFVHWPQVTEAQRTAGLAPLDRAQVLSLDGLIPDAQPIEAASLEMAGAAPVLRVRPAGASPQVFDLVRGAPLALLDRDRALAAASGYSAGVGAARADMVARDQWTVTGEFKALRPFWRVRLADRAATDLYISARTGELAQRTTAAGRLLNWLGPIPHWLYPAILRQDGRLWSQVVIWTSLAGTLLTAGGLYLGWTAWRPSRLTPYRGPMAWHHLAGLFVGLLTLTWVASGLVSMNPWGFLESPEDPTAGRLAGPPPGWGEARAALIAGLAAGPARQVRLAPFAGRLFVMSDGRRLDAGGHAASLTPQALAAAAGRLGPVAGQGMIAAGDAYYFTHHEPVRLPAWRVITADGRRAYVDPASGELLASVDASARGYRWLHMGLHRLDFAPGFDRGPAWAMAMIALLAAVTFGVGAGVWLGLRRAAHDLRRILRFPAGNLPDKRFQ
ncbi:MAG: peptidase [Phenylobacterium sp.]|nr:MAG: peptidase [Phenylobacterium sp.]